MDLSKFKHLKSDDKTTTLQHPDGHQITLAHGALAPATQKQLSALSRVATDALTDTQADQLKHKRGYADGGEIKKEYEIHHIGAVDYTGADDNDETENYVKKHEHLRPHDFSIVHKKSGEEVGSLRVAPHEDSKHIYVKDVNIEKEHRRKGLATAAYKLAEKHFQKPMKAGVTGLSKDSEALWSQKDRPFGNEKKKYAEGGSTDQQPIYGSKASLDKIDADAREKNKQDSSDMTSPEGADEAFHKHMMENEAAAKAEETQGLAKGGKVDSDEARIQAAIKKHKVSRGDAQGIIEAEDMTKNMPKPKELKKQQFANGTPDSTIEPVMKGHGIDLNAVKQMVSEYTAAKNQQNKDLDNVKQMVTDTTNKQFEQSPQVAQNEAAAKPEFMPFTEEGYQEALHNSNKDMKPDLDITQAIGKPQIPSSKMQAPAEAQPSLTDTNTRQPDMTPDEQNQQQQITQQIQNQANGLNQQGATTDKTKPGINFDPESMMKSGIGQQIQGIQETGKAQGDLGTAQAEISNRQLQAKNDIQRKYQSDFNELNNERMAHIQDIKNGHINPDKYWTGDAQGNGSHSRIASAIGMILGGLGGGSGATDFLKYQMDKNLEAQAKNLDSDQNLLAANLKQFGNMHDAMDMTRIMQNDIMATELQKAAQTAMGPLAKAAATNAAGKVLSDNAGAMQSFAMRRAMMGLANSPSGDPQTDIERTSQMAQMMRMTGQEDMANNLQSKIVPNIGVSSTGPVPEGIKSELQGKLTFDALAKRYMDFSKKNATNWRNFNPIERQKIINEGVSMATDLQNAYRQGSDGGVWKSGEQEMIEQVIPTNPAKFRPDITVLPKVEGLLKANKVRFELQKRAAGIPSAKTTQAPQEAIDQAPQIPDGATGTYKGKSVIRKNGHWVPK